MIDTSHAGEIWVAYDDERFVEVSRNEPAKTWTLRSEKTGEVREWADAERAARSIWPKCIDCDEAAGTCPGGRCRDCDIDWLFKSGSCRECARWLMRENIAGPVAQQHKAWCSLAHEPDCYPRTEEELDAVAVKRMEDR